jgi:hypothetical protein
MKKWVKLRPRGEGQDFLHLLDLRSLAVLWAAQGKKPLRKKLLDTLPVPR